MAVSDNNGDITEEQFRAFVTRYARQVSPDCRFILFEAWSGELGEEESCDYRTAIKIKSPPPLPSEAPPQPGSSSPQGE